MPTTPPPPLPEPIFAETVTDIDGTEAGEVEIEVNGSDYRSRRGGAQALDASAEIEWLATRRFGLRFEPTLSRDGTTAAGASLGASWKLLHDYAHDLHLQLELLGRVPWDRPEIAQPGDPAQPLALDLRGAWRAGPITLRPGVGVGAFGDAAHLPLRASLGLLAPFEGSGRFGFWGFELDVDGARPAPVIAAFEVVPNLEPLQLPFRVGVALPVTLGERDDRPSYGLFVRVMFESAREMEFGSAAGSGGGDREGR